MLPGVNVDLPPPTGTPQPPPAPAPEADAVPATLLPPYAVQPGHPDHAGLPGQPGQPGQPYAPAGPVGRNGLAIAALCCGLAAFIPLVGVLGVVFGVIALHQIRRGFQRGRAMAIVGIVLGALGGLAWLAVIVIGIATGVADQPQRDVAGQATPAQTAYFDDLKPGDCFDGVPAESDARIDEVTTRACTSPHEGQVAAIVEPARRRLPGREQVGGPCRSGLQ